jgi:hypothetical protein
MSTFRIALANIQFPATPEEPIALAESEQHRLPFPVNACRWATKNSRGGRSLAWWPMIVRQGVAAAEIGAGIGVAAALLLTRALQGLLYGVTATDPLTFGAMPLFVILIAALACYVRAPRAVALDPLLALRYE